MISMTLLSLSIILITFSYLKIILIYYQTKNIRLDTTNGFDLAKELTSNYNDINIVESKEINISKYNLRRKIIRLIPEDYSSNDIFTLSKIALLSGYSLLNLNQDKNVTAISKIIPNITYLNYSAIISILVSILSNTIGDTKISIIILLLITVYQYLINEINISSKEQVSKSLKKIVKEKNYLYIEKVQHSFLSSNKISFISTLILILRAVIIILN